MSLNGRIYVAGETGAGKSTLLHSLGFGAGGGISEDGRGVTREILSYELCSELAKFQVCDMPGYDEQDEVGNFLFLQQYIKAFNDVENEYALIIMINYNNGRLKKSAFDFINSLFQDSDIMPSQVGIIVNFINPAVTNQSLDKYIASALSRLTNVTDICVLNIMTVNAEYIDERKRKINMSVAFAAILSRLFFQTVKLSDDAETNVITSNLSSALISRNYGKVCGTYLKQATDLELSIEKATEQIRELDLNIREEKNEMRGIRGAQSLCYAGLFGTSFALGHSLVGLPFLSDVIEVFEKLNENLESEHDEKRAVRRRNKTSRADYQASVDSMKKEILELVKKAQTVCSKYLIDRDSILENCRNDKIELSQSIRDTFRTVVQQ